MRGDRHTGLETCYGLHESERSILQQTQLKNSTCESHDVHSKLIRKLILRRNFNNRASSVWQQSLEANEIYTYKQTGPKAVEKLDIPYAHHCSDYQ